MWGSHILDYYHHSNSDIILDVVSYDRRFNVRDNCFFFERVFWGIRDYYDSLKETSKLLKDNGPYDVLHLCTSAQLGLLKDLSVLNIAYKYGVRVVLHMHFGRVPEILSRNNWESILLRKVLAKTDAVIAIDGLTYAALQNSGYSQAFYLPNPLALPILDFVEKNKGSIRRINNKVVFVGHVIPSKGVFELVKACLAIKGVELHIIGSIADDIRSALIELSAVRDKGNWLKIRGNLHHDDVIAEMLSCAVFALPSYTEGFPNVILEAMACGCPIVATSVGAISEMLNAKEGICGLCVNPKDINGLRSAIVTMLIDREYASKCGLNAQVRVKEYYSMPVVWRNLVSIWKSLS